MDLYNRCFCGKTVSITYSECVFVALVIQNAVCMRHISPMACLSVQYFSHIILQMP